MTFAVPQSLSMVLLAAASEVLSPTVHNIAENYCSKYSQAVL